MVRTRFAPSPTGYLHIGGVRTALFCWLFARKHGGQFILRIDDTDEQRNVESALAPILHGLRWLGIEWDEGPEVGGPYGPYHQSQRLPRYQQAVNELLARGLAYRDFATTEEIQAEREAAQKEKRSFRYSRRFMAETDADAERFRAEGRQGVVRLKMPHEGKLVLNDLIRGQVEFEWANEQDHVIQRADGSCLYHLASVVDDYDFKITHVIRAEEHLSNTPRQVFIVQSLGYPLPEYAHLPVVAEPGSKNKLSKRKLDKYLKNRDFAQLAEHGERIAKQIGLATSAETFNPVICDFYEQVGYLPEAVVNYLALLGWSLDDRTEFFTREELCKVFTLERVNKAGASFDPKKLLAVQDHYMQQLPLEKKRAMVLPYLVRTSTIPQDASPEVLGKVDRILQAAGDRIKVAGDILAYKTFFVPADQVEYDPAALEKHVRKSQNAGLLLQAFRDSVAEIPAWKAAGLESRLHEVVESRGMKTSELVQPLRVALTGQAVGFGLFETLEILGRQEATSRIDRTLKLAGGSS